MWRDPYRVAGSLLGLSTLCLLIATIPLELWPTPRPGDSYVFNPPLFSAIWVERTLRPGLKIGANALVVLGLGALFRRDSASMSQLQRVFALGGLVGTGTCLLGTILFTTAGPTDIGRSLTALLVLTLSFLLIALGFLGWGAGYLRSENLRLGAALTGGPILTGAYVGLSIAGVELSSVDAPVVIIPTSAMALVIGYDLWIDNSVSDDR